MPLLGAARRRSSRRVDPAMWWPEAVLSFRRAPGARLVGLHRLGAPQEGLHDLPGDIYRIGSREQRLVAVHGIADQALVWRHFFPLRVARQQLDIVADHPFSRDLRARADRDRHVRAEPEAHAVVAVLRLFAEHIEWRRAETRDNFCDAQGQLLAGADIERHPLPAPRIDKKPQGGEGL